MKFKDLVEGKEYSCDHEEYIFRIKDGWLQELVHIGWRDCNFIYKCSTFTEIKEIKEEKKRYWLWVIKEQDRAYFEADEFLDENGRGSDGNEYYDKSVMFKKLEDRYIDV